MTFSLSSGCDLHIPHVLTPDDPNMTAKSQQNNLAVERWAGHFLRNCASECREEFLVWSHDGPYIALEDFEASPPFAFPFDCTITRIFGVAENMPAAAEVLLLINNSSYADLTFELGILDYTPDPGIQCAGMTNREQWGFATGISFGILDDSGGDLGKFTISVVYSRCEPVTDPESGGGD